MTYKYQEELSFHGSFSCKDSQNPCNLSLYYMYIVFQVKRGWIGLWKHWNQGMGSGSQAREVGDSQNQGRAGVKIEIFWEFLCPTYDSRGALCFLVCGSVRLSVCQFVGLFVRSSRFRLKFLVKVVFDEVEVQST